jgi:peroxiredoxin
VIAVDLDEHPDAGLAVLRSLRLDYPQVQDPRGGIAERYGVPGMPSSYLIDRHGRVRQVHSGYDDKDLEPLKAAVARLVGEK